MSAPEREKRLLLELANDSRPPVELPRSGVLSIGADRERVDFAIEGQGVAPVHCAIGRVKGGGWALKDLGSEYGVIVNGERVASRKLEVGDLILLGSRRVRVIDGDAPPPQPTSSAPAASAAAKSESPARARELETTSSLGSSPSSSPSSSQGSSTQQGAALPQVKGYRVERLLGRGGMGAVYLAVQESLGRPVALKVLAEKLAADVDFVRRFQSEARAAAALNHPNVVTVHDVWEDSGRHFLAMEYMDRGNLESRLARGGKLPIKEALEVLGDATKALVYAELRGIVHRDIKPANLMQNSVGTTKLADLGLAMHLEAEATEADNKKIFGTPHFISPEQARGEKTDVRSDMYSLGATMYRLLSGRTPFEGATTRDILRGHFLEQPKPLSEVAPEVRPELAAIVERLLRKKPDERFPSANVLLTEVERVKSLTLHGAPAPVAAAAGGGSRWALIGVGVLAIAGAAWFATRPGDDERPPNGANTNGAQGANANAGNDVDEPLDSRTAPQQPTPPPDNDTALKLRETEAENAYLKLARDLTDAERRDALRELAQRFEGATAAARFTLEAEQLNAAVERQAAAQQSSSAAVESWLQQARAALVDGDRTRPLADALRAVLALPTTPELSVDTDFLARRKALISGAVGAAIDECRAALKAADESEARGEFDNIEARLRPWLAALDLPEMPPALGLDAIPTLGDVIGLKGLVQRRLDGLEAARARFVEQKASGDSKALSDAMRGPDGIEQALARLDLAALERRLTGLEGALATPQSKQWASEWRAQLDDARAAFAALAREFDAGGWRRKGLLDPRSRGRASRDAIAVSAEGVLFKDDATGDLAPWSAFGAHPLELHQLFLQRLSREYDAREKRGIELLVRSAAVAQTVAEVADLLHPSTPGVLSDDEVRAIRAAFEAARTWAPGGAAPQAVDSEAQAAELLIEAVRATSAGSWSLAAARLDELLREHSDTLLVRLLSDGRGAKLGDGR
ncbi:MAG: protein kinase [Planctomycetes bacterium]|nr:protein kinase [Planctomycetota bacterium]